MRLVSRKTSERSNNYVNYIVESSLQEHTWYAFIEIGTDKNRDAGITREIFLFRDFLH